MVGPTRHTLSPLPFPLLLFLSLSGIIRRGRRSSSVGGRRAGDGTSAAIATAKAEAEKAGGSKWGGGGGADDRLGFTSEGGFSPAACSDFPTTPSPPRGLQMLMPTPTWPRSSGVGNRTRRRRRGRRERRRPRRRRPFSCQLCPPQHPPVCQPCSPCAPSHGPCRARLALLAHHRSPLPLFPPLSFLSISLSFSAARVGGRWAVARNGGARWRVATRTPGSLWPAMGGGGARAAEEAPAAIRGWVGGGRDSDRRAIPLQLAALLASSTVTRRSVHLCRRH